MLTEELDAQMSAALSAIKNKDPRIYDQNAAFYDDPENSQPPVSSEKKEKPVYLRDYHRERYMRGDVGEEDEKDGAEKPKTYVQEQEDLKQSLLDEIKAAAGGASGEDSDDDDDFIKKKGPAKLGENGVHPSRATRVQITDRDVASADNDPELYLSNFMASKAWKPAGGSRWEAFESDEEDEDNNFADEFEHAYNMRFEDPSKSNEVLKSYSRTITAARSVRREETKGRKRQREVEKEEKEVEKKGRIEERARLRKLKVDEAHEKLKKIKQAAGMSGKALEDEEWMKLLEDAWENDKWEEEMSKKFGEQYYAENDGGEAPGSEDGGEGTANPKKKPKKPKWDDDIDIKDIIPDFEDEDAKPDVTLSLSDIDAEDEDGDNDRPSKKRKKSKDYKMDRAEAKRAARVEHAKIEALVDTQMELDDPSAIASSSKEAAAGLPFRYRETSPNSFGLTARDILMAPSDAVLNEFVGLKKLATFRDPEKKRKDKKRLGKKARLRQWRRDTFGAEFEHSGPTIDFAGGRKQTGAGDVAAVPADAGDGDKKKKKRKRSKGKHTVAA